MAVRQQIPLPARAAFFREMHRETQAQADLASMPVQHTHAASEMRIADCGMKDSGSYCDLVFRIPSSEFRIPHFKPTLVRSKSYLGAYLRRQRSRLGAPKAITATAHKLARIFYTMMRYGVTYQKQSEAEFVEQNRQRLEKSLRRRAKELGFELKKIEAPPPDPAAAATPSD